MNKKSSIFLDQFAVDKILKEKLSRVSHVPGEKKCHEINLHQLPPLEVLSREPQCLTFASPQKSEFEENNSFPVRIFPGEQDRSRIIFVHGLYDENRTINLFLFSQLNKLGYTIYLYTLPYHYERKPANSLFSGEYFWSANFRRTYAAFTQGVVEINGLYDYLKKEKNDALSLCGFSMGGAIIYNLCARRALEDKVLLLNPVTNLSRQVWESQLWEPIKADLTRWKISYEEVENFYRSITPGCLKDIKTSLENIGYFYGEFDQVINRKDTMAFLNQFNGISTEVYKCGHLNMLRLPRLAEDLSQFCKKKNDRS